MSVTNASCREIIRQALLAKGLPPRSVDIMLSSLSDNTYKQYDSSIKSWVDYCKINNCDFSNASVSEVISFLTQIFDKGVTYGTVNSYKSALALILGNLTENNEIKRFMRGVFRLRPPAPKYDLTWDPGIVLNYFSQKWPNESLNLETLSKKTLTLLALVTAHRVQTFSLIKLSNIHTQDSAILIKIPDIIKTSRPNCYQPILKLPFFNQKPEICPARCLKTYIQKTSTLRSNNNDFLFISYRKPYSKLTAQRLSHWIKDSLDKSGVDTRIFSGHSTRHAATSAANRLGVSIDIIRKTAGWSDSSAVFGRFYNKEIINDSMVFSTSILSV